MRAKQWSVILSTLLAFGTTTKLLAGEIGSPPGSSNYLDALLDGGTAVVRAGRHAPGAATSGSGGTASRADEYRRAPQWICAEVGRIDFDAPAVPADLQSRPECGDTGLNLVLDAATCAPDERAVEPLFRRTQDVAAPDGWSEWSMVNPGGCVVDVDLRAAIAQELQRLPLAPSDLSVEPPSGWTLVNADTVVFTDDSTQLLDTTVLGLGVRIRATPQTFTWDFGDGSEPLRTDDPGRPWPEHTVSHRYTGEGTHRISLTTTWSAMFQLAGTTGWEPVGGTATTTSTSPPLTVHEARSHLVAGPTG